MITSISNNTGIDKVDLQYNAEGYNLSPEIIIDKYISNYKIALLSILPNIISSNDEIAIKQVVNEVKNLNIPIGRFFDNKHYSLLGEGLNSISKEGEIQVLSTKDYADTIIGNNELTRDNSFINSLPEDVLNAISVSNINHEYILDSLNDTVSLLITTIINRTIELLKHEQIREQSLIDPLTKGGNRRSFNKNLKNLYEYCKEYGESLTVILLDLDKFKGVNDRYGHNIGDKVLIEVAKILKGIVKKYEEDNKGGVADFGRVGGEEFGLMFSDATKEKIAIIEEEIQNQFMSIEIYEQETGLPYIVSASLGTVICDIGNESSKSLGDILKLADYNSYSAKRRGGARAIKGKNKNSSTEEILIDLKENSEEFDLDNVLLGVSKYTQKFFSKLFSNKYKLIGKDPEPINNLSGINGIYKSIGYLIYLLLEKKGYGEFEWLREPISNYIQEYKIEEKNGETTFLVNSKGNKYFPQIDLLIDSGKLADLAEIMKENRVIEKNPTIDCFVSHLVS